MQPGGLIEIGVSYGMLGLSYEQDFQVGRVFEVGLSDLLQVRDPGREKAAPIAFNRRHATAQTRRRHGNHFIALRNFTNT